MVFDATQFFRVSTEGNFHIETSPIIFLLTGTIETPINEDDLQGPKRQMMEERIPLGRFGRPEDIAEPVCFMASDMAKYSMYCGFLCR
jgi:hypothetical protein